MTLMAYINYPISHKCYFCQYAHGKGITALPNQLNDSTEFLSTLFNVIWLHPFYKNDYSRAK